MSSVQINGNTYNIIDKIGEGSFGKVYKTLKVGEYQYSVIKIIKVTNFNQLRYTENEIATLDWLTQKLSEKSPFPRLLEYQKIGSTYHIVMEYLEGPNLIEYLATGRLDEAKIKTIFRQLLLAVNILHSLEIVHRDLKLQNIMLIQNTTEEEFSTNVTFRVIIIDFGLACNRSPHFLFKYIEDRSIIKVSQTCTEYTKLGSIYTMAPELFLHDKLSFDELKRVDIWALGVILYVMVYNQGFGYRFDTPELVDKNLTIIHNKITHSRTIFSPILTEILQQQRPDAMQLITQYATFLNIGTLPNIGQTTCALMSFGSNETIPLIQHQYQISLRQSMNSSNHSIKEETLTKTDSVLKHKRDPPHLPIRLPSI